jgi:GH15 family glucan-1,4-alpha-glucosidase
MFYDKRFRGSDLGRLFKMLEIVGEKCASFYKEEDDFELGSPVGLHTVSAVLCWAGTDRLSKISDSLGKSDRAAYWRIRSEEIRTVCDPNSTRIIALFKQIVSFQAVLLNALSPDFNGFVSTYEPFEDDTHAQLLDIWAYGFLSYDDPRMLATVKHIEKHLRVGDGIKRTTRDKTLDFAATFTFASLNLHRSLPSCAVTDPLANVDSFDICATSLTERLRLSACLPRL